MLTKHTSNFAIYTSWVGKENIQTLVEEFKTLDKALKRALLYIHSSIIVYVVNRDGKVEWCSKPECIDK